MSKTLKEIMTKDPTILPSDKTAIEAARMMREKDMGSVLVEERGKLRGIVTDRDLVVRCLAEGGNPGEMKLGSLCSADVTTLAADAPLEVAVSTMRKKAIRRIPVVEGDKPVGIVSLGDLAMEMDGKSALGEISAAKSST